MPFKDFTTEILTSADVDLYLMSQVIIRCTAATRPASPAQGWHIYETDTNRTMRWTGSAWEELGASGPMAILTMSSSQSISANSGAAIAFNAEDVDTHNGHDTATNNSRYTCQKAGYYWFSLCVAWLGNSVDPKVGYVQKNSTGGYLASCTTYAAGSISPANCATGLVSLAVGDYINAGVFLASSTADTVIAGASSAKTRFYIRGV